MYYREALEVLGRKDDLPCRGVLHQKGMQKMSVKAIMDILKNNSELRELLSKDVYQRVLSDVKKKMEKIDATIFPSAKFSPAGAMRSALFGVLFRNGIPSKKASELSDKLVAEYKTALRENSKVKAIGSSLPPKPHKKKEDGGSSLSSSPPKKTEADRSTLRQSQPRVIKPITYIPSGKSPFIAPLQKRRERYQGLISQINDFERRAAEEQYTGKIIMPGENDVDNIEMARYFATTAMGPVPEICSTIGVSYTYDVRHTTIWFACQVGTTTVAYVHKTQNRSARRTYNHYRNPPALLWVALVMGEENEKLCEAATAMKAAYDPQKTDNANYTIQSAAIRKVIPFDRIMELWKTRKNYLEMYDPDLWKREEKKKRVFESLTVFIPDLEKGEFGDWTEQTGEGAPENPYTFCHIEYSEPVKELIEALFKFGGEHGEEMKLYPIPDVMDEITDKWPGKELTDIDVSLLDGRLTVGLLLFVLSMCRFNDNAFLDFCKEGTVLRCLRRLKEIDEDMISNLPASD